MLPRPPLSLALAPLRPPAPGTGTRALIEWAAASGFRSITLDGAATGVRPRELDRSARRDLAALLRRLELGFCGIDLWVPSSHLSDPLHADRAAGAIMGCIELAADIAALNGGECIVGVALPNDLPGGTRDTLLTHADAHGARLADHAWPPAEAEVSPSLGVGVDPASLLLAGENPAKVVSRFGERLLMARLSDASDFGRTEPGKGNLNDLAYAVALQTVKYVRPVILDVRGLADPRGAALLAAPWWGSS